MKTSTSFAPVSALALVLATSAAVSLAATTARGQCPADLDASGVVNGADLAGVLAAWGPCAQCSEDLDGDGVVTGSDLGQVLVAWGECPVTVPSWATLVEAQPDPAVVTDPALRAAIAATGQTKQKIHDDCDRDKWLNAQEMLEYGLIDGILERLPGK